MIPWDVDGNTLKSFACALVRMIEGDWPRDPADPRCPSCDEPVSATATYCMHCEVDLPVEGKTPAARTTGGSRTVDTAEMEEPDPGMPTADEPPGRRGWLHPDSLQDDVATLTVGIVGGVLDGFVLLLLTIWALPRDVQSSGASAVAIVGWLGTTVWIASTRTAFGAVRKAGYLFAGLLALTPPFVTFALRDPEALLSGVVVWPAAAVVAAAGWAAGRGDVDDPA